MSAEFTKLDARMSRINESLIGILTMSETTLTDCEWGGAKQPEVKLGYCF